MINRLLWFDVGIKRYTTVAGVSLEGQRLWFDVGIKRYTTKRFQQLKEQRCGLM